MKKCFVIMPISDHPDYSQGHFNRVYQYIIKPACIAAGFEPVRADDVQTSNMIVLDIIKNILNCEMAICDLSSRNPNVLYELGIRQAFNLPVALIKDDKTTRVFDIQQIRDFEYDVSMRADLVESHVPIITELIKNTYGNKDQEINSLVSLLGIEPAKQSKKTEISSETQLILSAISGLKERVQRVEQKGTGFGQIYYMGHPETTYFNLLHGPSDNLGPVLKGKDIDELQTGTDIYIPEKGFGQIIGIRGNNGIKKFDIRFGKKITSIELKESHLAQLVMVKRDES